MPQNQVFGFRPPSRFEAVAQHADEEEANCDHQSQSCSDSLAVVTPAEGEFGSDKLAPRRKHVFGPKSEREPSTREDFNLPRGRHAHIEGMSATCRRMPG